MGPDRDLAHLSEQNLPVAGRARNAPRIVLDARGWCIRDDLGRFGSRFSRAGEFGDLDSCSPDVHRGEDFVGPLAKRENRVFPFSSGRSMGAQGGVPGSQAAHQKYLGHSQKYLGVLSETQQTAPDPCRWRDDGHRARFVPRYSQRARDPQPLGGGPYVHQGEDFVRFLAKRENRVFPVLAISRPKCQKVSHRNTLPVSE